MEYYHNLVTEKSWQELMILRKTLDFVLIGGWAVYLYSRALKSKDIDIIIDFDQLPILEKNYQIFKNERLKKYEAKKQEVEIDIYLPHFSKFVIPVSKLIDNAVALEGFGVLDINYLLALKIDTLSKRGRSAKGRKDFFDIISLIASKKSNFKKIKEITRDFNMQTQVKVFKEFLIETTRIPELNLNNHSFARIKREIKSKL